VAAIVALHLQDTVDPTAIATLLLAVVTVALAWSAWRTLQISQLEIGVLREQGRELRAQGVRAHRPVIIPIFDHGRMDLGPLGTTERMPKLTNGTTLVVPTENIGAGPALYLRATAELRPQAHTPRDAAARSRPTELIGVAKTSPALLELTVEHWPADADFDLHIEYEDVAEGSWQTVGTWDAGTRRWALVDVKEVVRGDSRRLSTAIADAQRPAGHT